MVFPCPSCSRLISLISQCLILLLEICFRVLQSHWHFPQTSSRHMTYVLIEIFLEVLPKLGWLSVQVGRNVSCPTCHDKCMLFKYLQTIRSWMLLVRICLMQLNLWMIKWLLIIVNFWLIVLWKTTRVFQTVLELKDTYGNRCPNMCASYVLCL